MLDQNKPNSEARADIDLETLMARVQALEHLLQAVVTSHPNPSGLLEEWRRIALEAKESAGVEKNPSAFSGPEMKLYRALNQWSDYIHRTQPPR